MTTLLELTKKLHNTLALYNGAGHALGWKTEKVDKLLDESKRVIELAEQSAQQEPVAWLVCENWRKHSLFFTEEGAEDFKNAAQREDALSGNLARWKAKPLYTSPPAQRKPLTDEQLWANDQIMSLNANLGWHMDTIRMFARAIEAAHGIKEKTT